MKLSTYEAQTMQTWEGRERFNRSFLGLFEETGELIGKIKKYKRGDKFDLSDGIKKEAGDCYYYVTRAIAESYLLEYVPENVFTYSMDGDEDFLLNKLSDLAGKIVKHRSYLPPNIITKWNLKNLLITYITCLNSFVYWYGLQPSDILINNGAKLADRKKRGVLNGNGDDR